MKCQNPECQKEFDPRNRFQTHCSRACGLRHKRIAKVRPPKYCKICGAEIPPKRTYCDPCRDRAEKENYKKFCDEHPGYRNAYIGVESAACPNCGKRVHVSSRSADGLCKDCRKKEEEKRFTFTPEQIEMIRAAHGGKGEICQNCRRPFIRTYRGQVYCRRPECEKAAEREALRMETA